jgi:hypothetical protein
MNTWKIVMLGVATILIADWIEKRVNGNGGCGCGR